MKLNQFDALQVQTLYRQKLDAGVTPRRVRYIHVTLHKALKQAVRWQLVPRNVVTSAEPPRVPKADIKPLKVEQVKALLRAAETQSKLYALYVLAVTTGMRQGELLGLNWDDVDLTTGTVQVRRTVFNGQINAPKTKLPRQSSLAFSIACEPRGSSFVRAVPPDRRAWHPFWRSQCLVFKDLLGAMYLQIYWLMAAGGNVARRKY